MSALLNDDGNMCCMGFAAIQITGLTEEQIQGYGQFEELDSELHEFLIEHGTPFCEPQDSEHDYDPVIADTKFHNHAVEINDFVIGNSAINYGQRATFVESEEDREEQITALFKEVDIDVVFV
jgi:hypothetical protein